MFDFNDPSIVVQMCKFQAYIQKAHIVIKFPCSYFVEWKTINNRYSICTQKRLRTADDEAIFNQKLTFYTEMVYNTKKKQYYSKETFLVLNLVSKSRPDQVKLVGRISVDLAQVLNRRRFEQVSRMKLNYCSVEGSIVFGITLLNRRDSNLSVKDLDRSAFTDYFSLNPINRMMIEESLSGNYNNQHKSLQHGQRYQQHQHNGAKEQYKEQIRQQQPKEKSRQKMYMVPSFATITQQQQFQHPLQYPQQNQKYYQQKDQEVISFQNSQRQQQHMDRVINESPRTNLSKEQSLIQKLDDKNFRPYEMGNVVEVGSREARTDREANDSSSNGVSRGSVKDNSGQRGKGIFVNRISEQIESGQIRRQQGAMQTVMGVIGKTSSHSRLPSPPTQQPVANPTSPPSYQRQLTQMNSSSKFSQTSQYQNQQLLSIVQKLQHQKRQQESMIQSLKSMLANKNMKKKESSRSGQVEDVELQNRQRQSELMNRQKEMMEENAQLRRENERLVKQIQRKEEDSRQKHMHVLELLDKIKQLQSQLADANSKIKLYQDQIARLHLKEIENQNICQSLKLSLQNLQSPTQNPLANLLAKQSSKLLDSFKSIPANPFKEFQAEQKLPHSQQPYTQQQQQQIKIRVTKDDNIYQEIERENVELTERVSQLQEEIQIYKDLLKQQNSQPQLKESLPIAMPPSQVLQPEDVPFTITVSRNTNIYENYQNLQQENTQLYERIKELQNEVNSYKELLRHQNYPNPKGQEENHIMVESVEIKKIGEYQTSIKHILDVAGSEQQKKTVDFDLVNSPNHKNGTLETTPLSKNQQDNIPSETFKIILTKDKDIYKQQEEENIQLSKRVIQLEEEMERYKELLKQENDKNRKQSRSKTLNQATIEEQENYEEEGLRITLTQDRNIFENQQREISEYQEQVRQLQQTIQKYKSLYGPIQKNPRYKVSISREQRIYQDQELQIRDLMKSLQLKDDEVMELTARLSILERELEEYRPCDNSGEIKINIMRDENIYEEQEKDIRELSERVIQLEEKVGGLVEDIREKDYLLNKAKAQLARLANNKTNLSINVPASQNQTTQPSLSCLVCLSLQNQLLQLQTSIQLIQQQKTLLQEQIGALQEEKFCLTSTQNQLKITIEDLREEINLLGQENERLLEEIHYLQENLQERENQQLERNFFMGEKDACKEEAKYSQEVTPEKELVDKEKFANTLPENVFSSYKNLKEKSPQKSSTHHLQQLPQSPKTPKSPYKNQPTSPKPSQLLISLQQENTHLRQSLSTFQDQLQEQYLTIGQLEQRISRLMHEKEILFERDQQLSKEIILLTEKEQEVSERETGFRERISELEKELTSLKAQSLTTISTSNITRPDSKSQTLHQNQRIHELENELQTLKNELTFTKLAHQSSSVPIQQLRQKQQQIQELQTQLEALNQSLNELSVSYRSLQKNFLQLEAEKEAEVQSIRQEYETVNRTLKEDLETIEQMIQEKQKYCEESSAELQERGCQIEKLIEQIQIMKHNYNGQVNTLKDQIDSILRENQNLKKKLSTLEELKLQVPLSKYEINYKQKLLIVLEQIKLNKQQRDIELNELIPLISQRLSEKEIGQQRLSQEQLARNVGKEIQKIKVNIMRNYQTVSNNVGGVIQRTTPVKAGYNQDFKTFSEKSAMLNYLKPIEELIKGY